MRDIRPKRSRNIRFNPQGPVSEDLPPEVKKLYEKYAPPKEEAKPAAAPVPKQPSPAPKPATPPTPAKPATSKTPSRISIPGGSKVPLTTIHPSPQPANKPVPTKFPPKPAGKPSMDMGGAPKKTAPKAYVPPAAAAPEPAMEKRPLFATVNTSSGKPTTKKEARTKARLGHKERRVAAVLLFLMLIAGGLAAFIFLPKANIELVLQTAPLLVDEEITLASSPGSSGKTVPSTTYTEEVAVEGAAPVVSTQTVGSKASGTAYVVNRTFDEQSIKEDSRLVTSDGQLFYMQGQAIVPPAESSAVSRVPVTIEAAEAGSEGNIEPQRLNFAALDESAQSVVYAELDEPLTNGSGEEVLVVKEEDVNQARQAAQTMARQQVEEQIRAELGEGWTILEESWNMEIQDFQTSAKIDEQREMVPYTARVLVRVVSYESGALEQILRQTLEEKIDPQYMLFPGPISFTKQVKDMNWETQQGVLTARITHTTIPTFSLDTLKEKLAGRQKEEVVSYLQGLPGVQSAKVDLWPFWAGRIPRIENRVSIELVPDRQP